MTQLGQKIVSIKLIINWAALVWTHEINTLSLRSTSDEMMRNGTHWNRSVEVTSR